MSCIDKLNKDVLSRSKKLIFVSIVILVLFLILDTGLYVYLNKLQDKRNIFCQISIPTNEQLTRFYQEYFHANWGWDISENKRGTLGSRKSRNYESKKSYKIKTFGDSFTYGDDVNDDETFQSLIEKTTNWECLNYGVFGYGTDQALLKYRDTSVKSEYTVLGILDENIARCMTVWRKFLYPRAWGIPGTKPRFDIKKNKFVFVANPVTSYENFMKLHNIEFINGLKKYDYWTRYYKSKSTPTALVWPASATILPNIDFFLRNFQLLVKNFLWPTYQTAIEQNRFYHLYESDSAGLKILQYIVDEFIKTAKLRGEKPIIVVFPLRYSVDILKKYEKKPYENLVKYLNYIQCDFIDFGDVFVKEKYEQYYQGYDHFSVQGNERVASELINYIRGLEQLSS